MVADPFFDAGLGEASGRYTVCSHSQPGYELVHGVTMSSASISEHGMVAAVASLRQCHDVEAAYLLGSAAANRLRGDSDVDVAILPIRGMEISAERRIALTGELAGIFSRSVDLGVLSTRNVVYAKEAITKGRILFARDPSVIARFAMLVLSMYASLQEARREVLRAYAA